MLETTARLLQHRGYHGTALSDILEESAAPRGSLYFHFPGGKDQIVMEATRAAVAKATLALREASPMRRVQLRASVLTWSVRREQCLKPTTPSAARWLP